MAHDPQKPETWPASLVGYCKDTDCLIFRCGCNCGGCVEIPRDRYKQIEAARDVTLRVAAEAGDAPVFGDTCFIEGHAPVGIAGFQARSGPRTRLRPAVS